MNRTLCLMRTCPRFSSNLVEVRYCLYNEGGVCACSSTSPASVVQSWTSSGQSSCATVMSTTTERSRWTSWPCVWGWGPNSHCLPPTRTETLAHCIVFFCVSVKSTDRICMCSRAKLKSKLLWTVYVQKKRYEPYWFLPCCNPFWWALWIVHVMCLLYCKWIYCYLNLIKTTNQLTCPQTLVMINYLYWCAQGNSHRSLDLRLDLDWYQAISFQQIRVAA